MKAVIVASAMTNNFIRAFDDSDLGEDLEDEPEDAAGEEANTDGEVSIAFDFQNGTKWRQ